MPPPVLRRLLEEASQAHAAFKGCDLTLTSGMPEAVSDWLLASKAQEALQNAKQYSAAAAAMRTTTWLFRRVCVFLVNKYQLFSRQA